VAARTWNYCHLSFVCRFGSHQMTNDKLQRT
jgi:hypothetical protein